MSAIPIPAEPIAARSIRIRSSERRRAIPGSSGVGARLAALVQAGWAAVTVWRDRRRAVGHLRRLNDSQLRDLGITRLEIELVVHGGVDPRRRGRGRQ